MPSNTLLVVLESADGEDAHVLDRLTGRLRSELRDLGFEVEYGQAPPQRGHKGAGELVVGALIVASTWKHDVLKTLVDGIVAFAGRNDSCKIQIRVDDKEINLEGVSRKHVDEIARRLLDGQE